MAISTALLTLYVNCYFGKMATESYTDMSDCLFQSNWQAQSIKLQKYIIIMIGNAQQPYYYHGFNLATLQLETFISVSLRLADSLFIIKFVADL